MAEHNKIPLLYKRHQTKHPIVNWTNQISIKYNECCWTNLSVRRHQQTLYHMHNVKNGMVPIYIADLISPLVRAVSGYPLRNKNIFLHHSLEQIFHQDQVYHQLSECGTILMKVLKANQQYRLSRII